MWWYERSKDFRHTLHCLRKLNGGKTSDSCRFANHAVTAPNSQTTTWSGRRHRWMGLYLLMTLAAIQVPLALFSKTICEVLHFV